MARPTKKEIEIREAIKDLKLFVRDSEIYTYLERRTQDANFTSSDMSYLFCKECDKRNYTSTVTLNVHKLKYSEDSDVSLQYRILEPLLNINHELASYLLYLHLLKMFSSHISPLSLYFGNTPKYYSETLVYKKDIEKAVGMDLSEIVKSIGIICSSTISNESLERPIHLDDELINISFIRNFLSNKDKEKLKTYYQCLNYNNYHLLNYLTLITRNHPQDPKDGLERNVFAELDLTKPLESLIEFVTMLKNDYDNDPTSISNFHRLIGMELKDHKCSTKICDIYKHKNPKPLIGRLMDILFIYDCGKAKLDDAYIMCEIDRYWNDVKKIHMEQITKNTLQRYRKLSIDYIDNLECRNFKKGYVIPID